MNIYLVRHGETDWNRATKLQGQVDIDINENGVAQAKKAAKRLEQVPFERAFCSPLIRARHTAGILIGERNIPLTTDDRLKEINFGKWEGTLDREALQDPTIPIYDFFKNPGNYEPGTDGESLSQLYARTHAFVKEMLLPLEGKYENVLVVGHGAMNRSILNPIADVPVSDFWHFHMGNCATAVIECKDGKLKLLAYIDEEP